MLRFEEKSTAAHVIFELIIGSLSVGVGRLHVTVAQMLRNTLQ
jgi:hypothetical protein